MPVKERNSEGVLKWECVQGATKCRGRRKSEGSHRCGAASAPGLHPSQGQTPSYFMHMLFQRMEF